MVQFMVQEEWLRSRFNPLNQADGSNSLKWWTRRELNPRPSGGKEKWTHTQRIRALAEIPIEVAILDTSTPPIYEEIAPKALQLQQLGMSKSAIARRLGVTDRTVAKAIAWLGRVEE